uniref:Uncharacterized protein n=1 Tax=Picea glauca TaxID=3330 RepID=A0A124GMG2_PICGL|nr:hypothetical protein ABT39_MTgene2383 [Picea glauca]
MGGRYGTGRNLVTRTPGEVKRYGTEPCSSVPIEYFPLGHQQLPDPSTDPSTGYYHYTISTYQLFPILPLYYFSMNFN